MIGGSGIINQPNQTLKQKSLLSKYEIPIDHLSFEYVRDCKDVKELERIVKILRSGEEGYYPDLQRAAEERLHSVSPNNRHLRSEEPVLTRNSMKSDEWNNISSEISNWQKEISVRDLRLTEENNNSMEDIDLPPVRQPTVKKCSLDKKVDGGTTVRKRVSDYTAWDKYDADTELLKMDLEEERRKNKKKPEPKKVLEDSELEKIAKEVEKLTETERRTLAEQEKDRGNEFFKDKDYKEAIKHYTKSITICPTANAFNNRAISYLKLCQFTQALADTNSTLALEPDNVKALFRRGLALQHKNMFKEALQDMTAVLKQEPKNLLAEHICGELRDHILTMPGTSKMTNGEVSSTCGKFKHLTKSDLDKVNEWGLPKVMCLCDRNPRLLQQTHQMNGPSTSFQHRPLTTMLPTNPSGNARIVEISDEPQTSKVSTKLKIVEVEKSEEPVYDDYYAPKRYNIIDKRTQKVSNGGVEKTFKELSSVTNKDSSMDEDFELNCPLLEDPEPSA